MQMKQFLRAAAPTASVVAAFAALCFTGSSTWLGIKIGLEGSPAVTGAGIRFVLVGAVLALFRLARGRSLRVPRGELRTILVLALFLFALPQALVYLAETQVTSGLAAVLFGSMPLMSALVAIRLLPAERLSRRDLLGVGVGIIGVGVAFHGGLALRAAPLAIFAMIGLIVGAASWAFSQAVIKRRHHALSPSLMLAWSPLLGGALLLGLGLAFEPQRFTFDTRTIGAMAYVAATGVAGYALVFWLIDRIAMVYVSMHALVIPILALVWGAVLYGEPLSVWLVFGAVIVASGIALTTLDAVLGRDGSEAALTAQPEAGASLTILRRGSG